MVSVVFAIWPFPRAWLAHASSPASNPYALGPTQQATCQFRGRLEPALASILHGTIGQGRKLMMSLMYQAYQNHMDLTSPWRTGAAAALKYLNLVPQGISEKTFSRLA